MRQQPDEHWNGYPNDRAKDYEFIIIIFRFEMFFSLPEGGIEKQNEDDWNREKKWVNGIKVRGEKILKIIGFRPCI